MHSGGDDCCENWDWFVLHPLCLSLLDAVALAVGQKVLYLLCPCRFLSLVVKPDIKFSLQLPPFQTNREI